MRGLPGLQYVLCCRRPLQKRSPTLLPRNVDSSNHPEWLSCSYPHDKMKYLSIVLTLFLLFNCKKVLQCSSALKHLSF